MVKKQRRQRKLGSQSQKHYHHTFLKEIIGQTITFLSNWNLRNTTLEAYIICLVVLPPSSSLGLGRLYWKRYQTNPLCFLALTFPAGISAELILGFSYTYIERDVMKELRNLKLEEEDYFKHFYWTDIYLNHLIDNFIFLYTHTIFIHFQKNIKKVLIKLPFYWNFPSVTKIASNHLFHYCIIIISNNNLFRRHIFKKYIKKMVDVYTTISFCSLGLLIHVVGLTLLHIRDDMNLYGTQISLITALSLTEMSFLLVEAVRDWILYRDDLSDYIAMFTSNCNTIVLSHMRYFTMFGITIYRLQIRLNVKYEVYWNSKSTKKVLLTVFIILNLLYFTYLLIAIVYQCYDLTLKILKNFHKYVSPVYYTSFTITASAVYFYIFGKIYKNQEAHERSKKTIKKGTECTNRKSPNSKYFIPFWIIATFILFRVIPDIILTLYLLHLVPSRQTFRTVIVSLFRIGYFIDPIIYIYNLRIVKSQIRKMKASISSYFW